MLCCVFQLLLCFAKEGTAREGALTSDTFQVGFTAVYFIFDLMIVILYHGTLGELSTYIHHITCIIPFGFGSCYGHFLYMGHLAQVLEFSTPFVNNHWFISQLGYRSSWIYTLNLFGMWITFLAFRIIFVPGKILPHYYFDWDGIMEVSPIVWISVLFASVVVFVLSSMWFLMISKALSANFSGKDQKRKKKEEKATQ